MTPLFGVKKRLAAKTDDMSIVNQQSAISNHNKFSSIFNSLDDFLYFLRLFSASLHPFVFHQSNDSCWRVDSVVIEINFI